MPKGRSTQHIVNTFPGWADIRTDEQSLGFQFLNVVGNRFDDLRKQEERIAANYFMPTAVVSDIDVYYSFQLPGSYVFAKGDDDDTQFTYTPPTVSGLHNDQYHGVSIAENNDIESFWYSPVPDRISLETTMSGEYIVASGLVQGSPLTISTPSGLAHIPNKLTVKVDGGSSFVGIESNGIIRRGLVQVEGLTREGLAVTEELVFLHDEVQQTYHEFKSVDETKGVRVYGINNADEASVLVTSARFNQSDYEANYNDLGATVYGDDMPVFWSLGTTTSGVRTLDLSKYDIDEIELRIEGFAGKQVILQQELRDTVGNNITPLDLAIEPHSDRIWVVDANTLYVYSALLPQPDLSALSGKEYDAISAIVPSSYHVVLNDEVELDYVWRKPTTGLVAHRAWVVKPDGTTKSLVAGLEVTYDTSSASWIYGEPVRRKIRDTESYVLNQRGDWVYCLEVRYTDETTSLDKRIVSVLSQQPLAQFDLSSIITPNCVGVDFDSEYKLWVLGENGYQYEIDLHYDVMLVDFKRKILYFREDYDQVRVN